MSLFLETLSSLGFPASLSILSSSPPWIALYLPLQGWDSPGFHPLVPALLHLFPSWAHPHPHVIHHLEAHDSLLCLQPRHPLELQILIRSYLPSDTQTPLNLKPQLVQTQLVPSPSLIFLSQQPVTLFSSSHKTETVEWSLNTHIPSSLFVGSPNPNCALETSPQPGPLLHPSVTALVQSFSPPVGSSSGFLIGLPDPALSSSSPTLPPDSLLGATLATHGLLSAHRELLWNRITTLNKADELLPSRGSESEDRHWTSNECR